MIVYHLDLVQGSEEWLAMRCGLLCASEMKLLLTPALKPVSNDKERAHFHELLAQRITRYVEPVYVSDDMLRGREDEIIARALYAERYALVQETGFVTNERWGFKIGYSPDGLVGHDGLLEIKSRRQKHQIATILSAEVPDDYLMQVQTGLLVTERDWLDFVSYSAGLPMITLRVYPDPKIRNAIIEAASAFNERMTKAMAVYADRQASAERLIATERRVEQEMFV